MNLNKRIIKKISQYTFLLSFIFLSNNSFGQKLIPYQISENVSIQIPQDFNVTDTLGHTIIRASLKEEVILIMKQNKKIDAYIENKDELLKFYEGFQKGMSDKGKGKLIDQELVQINGMYFLKSSFRTGVSGEDKIWNNYILLLNKTSYTFAMISSPEKVKNVSFFDEKIISSIKFKKDLTQKNQMNINEEDSQAYKIGRLMGGFLVYGIIIGIILFFALRKRRK
jgi:tetrahydromethanopterin S-methyltransferase subunit G